MIPKPTLLGIGLLACFISGIIIGLNYAENECQTKVTTIQRDHATDLAEQISMETELYYEAVSEQQRKEQAYQQALQVLNRRLYEKQQALQQKINELNQLEQSDEKIRNLGDMPTPDAVVEWLQ